MNSLKWDGGHAGLVEDAGKLLERHLVGRGELGKGGVDLGFGNNDLALSISCDFSTCSTISSAAIARHAVLALKLQERRALLDVVAGDCGVVDDVLDLARLRRRDAKMQHRERPRARRQIPLR